MKRAEGHDMSRSCSCTSCVYKSESDHPSVRCLLKQGSKIDKHYLGKYVPLRERKLLDRVVKTRALYDDIRNQLLSGSSISIQEKATLKLRKHSPSRRKENNDSEKSIIELVDIVDKGKVLEQKTKNLNNCCSCCGCGEAHARAHPSKLRLRHAHHGAPYPLYSETMISGRIIGDDGRKRGVRFKARHISSEPCTCTTKIRDMLKRHSHEIIKKLRTERPKPMLGQLSDFTIDDNIKKRSRPGKILGKSYKTIRRSKTYLQSVGEGAKSKIKLKIHLEAGARESKEKFNNTRDRVKESLDNAVRKSINRAKSRELPSFEETVFQIKKDSIAIFKEKLRIRRRHFYKYKPCKTDCNPGESDPQECFRIIKRRRARRRKTEKRVPDQYQPAASENAEIDLNKKASSKNILNVGLRDQQQIKTNETVQKQQKITSQTPNISAKKEASNTASKGFEQEIIIRSKSRRILKYEKVIHRSPGHAKVSADIKNEGVKKHVEVNKLNQNAEFNKKEEEQPKALSEKQKDCVQKEKSDSIITEKKKTSVKFVSMLPIVSSESISMSLQEEKSDPLITEKKKTYVKFKSMLPIVSSESISMSLSSSKRKKQKRSAETVINQAATRNKGREKEISIIRRHQTSQTLVKKPSKGIHTGAHSLKRCFCTWKLKPKGARRKTIKSVSRNTSTQSKTMWSLNPSKVSDPERTQVNKFPEKTIICPPGICTSKDCDPFDCYRLLNNRKKKKGSSQESTELEYSLFSKYLTNASSVGVTSNSSDKIKKVSVEPIQEKNKKCKRANRHQGSHIKRRLPQRDSQISISPVTSKYKLTKHGLRRCFCTLKLAHPKRTKTSYKEIQPSQSEVPKSKPQVITRTIGTEKEEKLVTEKYKLQSNECEPGICVPGECDPYQCLQLINKRIMKFPKHIMKQSITVQRKTKSTSSVPSRSISNKTKKVNSSEFLAKKNNKKKTPAKMTSSSPDRQIVRIGSTFSVNIEFYKDKESNKESSSPPISNISGRKSVIKAERKPKTHKSSGNLVKSKLKGRGHQNIVKSQQNSTSTLITGKNKGSLTTPVMKRCFCTLKIQPKGKREQDLNNTITVGTDTPVSNRDIYKNATLTKGTKTKPEKHKIRPVLEPYECEPIACVPGKCDPYQCLKRIKKGKLTSKNLGIVTDQSKTKSNVTNTLTVQSRAASVRTKVKRSKNVYIPNKHKLSLPPKVDQKTDHCQTVRLGSNFSFNVEFNKDRSQTSAEKYNPNAYRESSNEKLIRHLKNIAVKAKSNSSHRDTQVARTKKASKSTGLRPMVKRCFCTLQSQSNYQNLQTKQKSVKDRSIGLKQQRIYTVSRITIAKADLRHQKRMFAGAVSHEHNNAQQNGKLHDSVLALDDFREVPDALSISSALINYGETKSFVINHYDMKSYLSYRRLPITKSHCQATVIHSNFITPRLFNNVPEKYICSEDCLLWRKYHKMKRNSRNTINECVTTRNLRVGKLNLTGASQLFQRRYCTMNLQVSKRKNNLHKLKAYEPGICVPGTCDPYECQKLIMKRLMKRVSRMSGANVRSRSISSSAAPSASSSTKKMQSRQNHEKVKKTCTSGITYKALPSRQQQQKHTGKQAVRVGSSFNFNIEFSKDRPKSPSIAPPRRVALAKSLAPAHSVSRSSKIGSIKLKTKGTRGRAISWQSRDSQSIIKTEHRGSSMKPTMKRCFCTLKLQKRGKQQKETPSTFHKGTCTPPNSLNDIVTASQNNKKPKPVKLLPVECECLERIKIRNKQTKDFGTGVTRRKNSSSSMIGRVACARTQSKQVAQPKIRCSKRANQTLIKSTDSRQSKIERSTRHSRQAVRIGSSLSINGEFYKEKCNLTSGKPQRPSLRSVKAKEKIERPQLSKLKQSSVSTTGTTQMSDLKNRASQDFESICHRDSQIGNLLTHASTMTVAFMKRCFCTAKLHGKQKLQKQSLSIAKFHRKKKLQKRVSSTTTTINNIQIKEKSRLQTSNSEVLKQALRMDESKAFHMKGTKTFLKRCFCLLKFKSAKKSNTAVANAFTGTDKDKALPTIRIKTARPEKPRYQLDHYECEPGTCTSGECNPYECEKLIKLRNMRLESKANVTDRPRTRSISSIFQLSKASKAQGSQSNLKSSGSGTKNRPTKTVEVKEVTRVPIPTSHATSDRQVVRFGSQFSFDIEFYKDRTFNADEVQSAAKAIKATKKPEKKRRNSGTQEKRRKTRDSGSTGLKFGAHDQESQAIKAKTKNSGIGPLLRRCFCTLKLQKPIVRQVEMTTQGTETPAVKETPSLYSTGVMTQKRKWKLKPYECEPNVCIPYECDPYECEKLIKKRLMKESNKRVMTTKHNKLGYNLLPYECEPNTYVPVDCDPYECEKRIKLRNMKCKKSGTSTKRLKAKSISSDIPSTTSSKERKIQAKRLKQRNVPCKKHKSSKPKSRKSYDKSHVMRDESRTESPRQSVRLGSGYSFDIEFYKDRVQKNNFENLEKPRNTKRINRCSTSSLVKRTKNQKMQNHLAIRDTDSQIQAKMHDSGVNTLLKRCFCTLKLQSGNRTSDQSLKMRCATGPNYNTKSRATRDKSVYLAMAPNLLPYECEPGVCVPGVCDPYEPDKRIKRRLKYSQMSGTDKTKRYTSRIQKQAKASNPKSKFCDCVYDPIPIACESQPLRSCNTTSVRVGSSFNIGIEFFTNKVPQTCKPFQKPKTYEPCAKILNTVSRSKKTCSKSISSAEPPKRDYKLQTITPKNKSTDVPPVLKKCFCTLALKKDKCIGVRIKENLPIRKEIAVSTRKHIQVLDPYECEPNFCIPGSYDTYKCYERIKLRRLKESGTRTEKPIHKCTSGMPCNEPTCRSFGIQCDKQICERETTIDKQKKVVMEALRKPCKPCVPTTKEVTRFGSNITFNIEFYKERTDTTKLKIPKRCTMPTESCKPLPAKKTSISNKSKKQSTKDKKIHNDNSYPKNTGYSVTTAARATGMGALLKRCFFTLNLRKDRPSTSMKERHGNEKKVPQRINNKLQISQDKPAKVKKRKIKNSFNDKIPQTPIAKPNMANIKKPMSTIEPYVCVPGQCNPYECLKRIERRQMKQHSRKTGVSTPALRPSQKSVPCMAMKLVPHGPRRVQTSLKRERKGGSPHKRSLTCGSKIDFGNDFYEEKCHVPVPNISIICPEIHENSKDHKVKKIKVLRKQSSLNKATTVEKKSNTKHQGTSIKTRDAKVDSVKMKVKAADANNLLKRCFCTLKLQKNEAKTTARPHNIVTVNRLFIDNTWNNAFRTKPKLQTKCSEVSQRKDKKKIDNFNKINYLIQRNSQKHLIKKKIKQFIKHHSNSTEMQTIYPYVPSNFHKNISKPIILPHEKVLQYSMKKGTCDNQLDTFVKRDQTRHCTKIKMISETEQIKDSRNSEGENLQNHTFDKSHNFKMLLRSMFTRIFFPSKNNEYSSMYDKTQNLTIQDKSETQWNQKITRKDVLKTSKSDRPTRLKITTSPKTTISLKVPKLTEKRHKTSYRDKAPLFQKSKIYSHFQYGDTDIKRTLLEKSELKKSDCSQFYFKKFDKCKDKSPFADNIIVQMALVPKEKPLKNSSIGYEKGDTCESNNILGKCVGFFKGKNISNKIQDHDQNNIENCLHPTRKSRYAAGDPPRNLQHGLCCRLRGESGTGQKKPGKKRPSRSSGKKQIQNCTSLYPFSESYKKAPPPSGDSGQDDVEKCNSRVKAKEGKFKAVKDFKGTELDSKEEEDKKSVKAKGKKSKRDNKPKRAGCEEAKSKEETKAVKIYFKKAKKVKTKCKKVVEAECEEAMFKKTKGSKTKGKGNKEAKFKGETVAVKVKSKKTKGGKSKGIHFDETESEEDTKGVQAKDKRTTKDKKTKGCKTKGKWVEEAKTDKDAKTIKAKVQKCKKTKTKYKGKVSKADLKCGKTNEVKADKTEIKDDKNGKNSEDSKKKDKDLKLDITKYVKDLKTKRQDVIGSKLKGEAFKDDKPERSLEKYTTVKYKTKKKDGNTVKYKGSKSDKHGKHPKPGQRRKFYGAKITIRAKGDPTAKPKPKTKLDPKALKKLICTCGSKVGSKELSALKAIKKTEAKAKRKKPCFYGTHVYADMAKNPLPPGKVCECKKAVEEYIKKSKELELKTKELKLSKKAIRDKKRLKADKLYYKQTKLDDKLTKAERLRREKRMDKQASKYGEKGDLALATGSVGDILKLGFVTVSDIAKFTGRAIVNPRRTAQSIGMKCADIAKNPLPPGKVCECKKAVEEYIKKNKELELKKKELKLRKKAIRDKKRLKADKLYYKQTKLDDKLTKAERLRREKRMDKQASKYGKKGDLALATGSVGDILKLGFVTVSDIAKFTGRAIVNPRRTAQSIGMEVKDPVRAFGKVKSAVSGSGLFSTARRVKRRLAAMKSIQGIKGKMEEHAATHYLININNPKKRKKFKKKKKVKVKEQTDFECNAYMSSLRKRPWLSVYYACPWFYPQCLSLLQLWRQMREITLYLLAVLVWSPFILLMVMVIL